MLGGDGGGMLSGDGGSILGGDGGGILGGGDVPVEDKKEESRMPEIEDVVEDDHGGLSLPKLEEDSVIFPIVGPIRHSN